MKTNRKLLTLFGAFVLTGAFASAAGSTTAGIPQAALEDRVRHELLSLPYYNVFEDLYYRVDGDVVTLSGKVTRPIVSRDAVNAVKRLAGVERVDNQIEVLPLSSYDNRLRLQAYYAIYGFAPLQRYGLGTQPSIRILVKNGNVTLAGAVRSAADRDMAFLRANAIPGALSVSNELRVERD
jgi:hyperosmotically inducible protein